MSKIPETMLAAVIDEFGGPEVLSVREVPVPEPNAREILIHMHTAGVGIWDARTRDGAWAEEDKKFPYILGTDGSGVVAAVGANVTRFDIGDRVYSYSYDNPKGGFYAEYVAVAASKAGDVPESLDLLHAGAVPTIGLTALQGVDDALHITFKDTLLIHGGSGNVGMMAVQFAKLRKARVIATASGRDGIAFVKRLGADEVIDGRRRDLEQAIQRLAAGGVDAVLGFAGGPELTRCLNTLRRGGRAAYPNGVEPAPKKRKGVKIKAYDAVPGAREFQRLTMAFDSATIEVPIAAEFRLDQVEKAHRRVEKGHVLGKIVLRIAD